MLLNPSMTFEEARAICRKHTSCNHCELFDKENVFCALETPPEKLKFTTDANVTDERKI